LKYIYNSATVRLAPNNAESATITFDTGVAQGGITSSQLFNIFINTLLQMLMATGENQGISHALQIGKDQDDSSQDANHSYQFNNDHNLCQDICFLSGVKKQDFTNQKSKISG